MMENINWYPGHMKKTRELIQQNLKMVDAVVEVIDARIPVSSRNPIIDELVRGKPRIIVLNKSDLADENASRAWTEALRTDGSRTLAMATVSTTVVSQGRPCRLQFSSIKLISKEALCATMTASLENSRNSGKTVSIVGASITMLSLMLVNSSIRNGIGTFGLTKVENRSVI